MVIVCAEEAVDGTSLRTCPYRSEKNPQNISDVTFHKVAVPVKVYELRTGRMVSNTRVQIDGVMAQVDIQAGPHRVVSLMSAEAARDLDLQPGSLAVAVIKATNVIVETPRGVDS